MRARTIHSTTGRRSRSFGCLTVGSSVEVSTGVDLGSERCRDDGVEMPGVEGGVKAGEIRLPGRPGVAGPASPRSDH